MNQRLREVKAQNEFHELSAARQLQREKTLRWLWTALNMTSTLLFFWLLLVWLYGLAWIGFQFWYLIS